MQTLNIPFEHRPGKFRVRKFTGSKPDSLEIRRLDNDIIEYDHPVTGRLVRIYDVKDRYFKRMEARYYDSGQLGEIDMPRVDSLFIPPWKRHILHTLYFRCSNSDEFILTGGDILCDEVVNPLIFNRSVVSRLFVEYHYDDEPSLSVIVASPEDVQKYSADKSEPYPESMRHHDYDEFIRVILAGTEDPEATFNNYVTYVADAIAKKLDKYWLTTHDFCVIKEERH